MGDDREGKATPLAEALGAFAKAHGLDRRLARHALVGEWAAAVGPQIAGVTQARTVLPDGTLVVGVRTHAWMTELQLMERQLLAKVNARASRTPARRIRWELLR